MKKTLLVALLVLGVAAIPMALAEEEVIPEGVVISEEVYIAVPASTLAEVQALLKEQWDAIDQLLVMIEVHKYNYAALKACVTETSLKGESSMTCLGDIEL